VASAGDRQKIRGNGGGGAKHQHQDDQITTSGGSNGGGGEIRGTLGHVDDQNSNDHSANDQTSNDAGQGGSDSQDNTSNGNIDGQNLNDNGSITKQHGEKSNGRFARHDDDYAGQKTGSIITQPDDGSQPLVGDPTAIDQQTASVSMMTMLELPHDGSDQNSQGGVVDAAAAMPHHGNDEHQIVAMQSASLDSSGMSGGSGGFVGQLVPEPASLGLFGVLAAAGLLRRRQRA